MEIKDIMTHDVYALQENDTILDAADLMTKHDIGAIPIIDNKNRIVGIVTDRDIVIRAVSQEISLEESVGKIMSTDVYTIKEVDPVGIATKIMSDFQIRRLPVINNAEELIGIVALGDISTNELCDLKAAQALSEISMPNSDHESTNQYDTHVDDFPL